MKTYNILSYWLTKFKLTSQLLATPGQIFHVLPPNNLAKGNLSSSLLFVVESMPAMGSNMSNLLACLGEPRDLEESTQ